MTQIAGTERKGTSAHPDASPVILNVAFPYAPIGSKAVGGAEVICSQLEAALSSLGFASVVVAHAASTPEGHLYGTEIPDGEITDDVRHEVERRHQANIDQALARHPVALVHMHGLDFHRYCIPEHVPVLVTLHLPPAWYPDSIWSLPANVHLVCVSRAQLQTVPEHARERIVVVENGVPLPSPEVLRVEGRYALMLARICPEKNLHTGLDAARLAGVGALLGGETFPYTEHQRYFQDEIEPRLTSFGKDHEARQQQQSHAPVARFVGPVSGDEKNRLLSRAACLLLPSLAPETSSLVAMEALSAGVPVIGMAVGAVPEIVEHGRTGFLLQPGEQAAERMAALIQRLPEISRATCRQTAEERFPLQRMLDAYAKVYRQHAVAPKIRPHVAAHPEQTDLLNNAEEHNTQHDVATCVNNLKDDSALAALEAEWTLLWKTSSSATPFQHPAWLLPWWRQFGSDGQLNSIAIRTVAEDHLVGLAPLYIYREPATSECKLLFIGAGTTDYLDGLWADKAPGAAHRALETLLRHERPWDQAYLHQLRATSPLLGAASGAQLQSTNSEPTSTIDVSLALPPKIRLNVNRYRHRADERGGVACKLAETRQDALASFDDLVRLHRQRWESRGEPGVLSEKRVLAHHREALPLLLDAGLLRMFRLSASGQTVGVLYGLADGPQAAERRIYLYLVGFDTRFADLSPGTLLLHEAWLHARHHGFAKLDLLRGGENYKQLWGATAEPTFALQIS